MIICDEAFSKLLHTAQKNNVKLNYDKLQYNTIHTEAFTTIKQEIIRAPVLKYYDPKKPTVLQTDASIKGLGACLLQCEHPVYFGSKALTDSQKGYVAIELELDSGLRFKISSCL